MIAEHEIIFMEVSVFSGMLVAISVEHRAHVTFLPLT